MHYPKFLNPGIPFPKRGGPFGSDPFFFLRGLAGHRLLRICLSKRRGSCHCLSNLVAGRDPLGKVKDVYASLPAHSLDGERQTVSIDEV